MVFYEDSSIKITNNGVVVKGILVPKVSTLNYRSSEIESVEVVPLKKAKKLWLFGTTNLLTWWNFDPTRFLKNTAFVINHKDVVFQVAVTLSDDSKAINAFEKCLGKGRVLLKS